MPTVASLVVYAVEVALPPAGCCAVLLVVFAKAGHDPAETGDSMLLRNNTHGE